VSRAIEGAGSGRQERWAIIGAGWSGLACAVEGIDRGAAVTLIDAAPAVGGRARRVDLKFGDVHYTLDNGQHLLLGACSQTLALMRRVGVDPDRALLARPFSLRYPDGWQLQAMRAPAPWHLALGLVGARSLPWRHRIAMAGFVAQAGRDGWRRDPDCSVAQLLLSQPPELVRRLWRPLCVAAMNAEPELCSANIFLNLLRLSLGGRRHDSDLLLTRKDLSATMPLAALDYLQRRGTQILLRQAAIGLHRSAHAWSIELREQELSFDRVVLAVPADSAARLLGSTTLETLGETIRLLHGLRYEPLATVYLRYPGGVRLAAPLYALLDDAGKGRFGQWVFDRGAIDASHGSSILGVVIGGPCLRDPVDHAVLCSSACRQLQADFKLPPSQAQRVVVERRATLLAAVGLQRPPARLPAPGLYLAGDAAASAFPSTLEGSVRAGLEAAGLAAADRELRI